MGKVIEIPEGVRGFDCNTRVTYDIARRFVAHAKPYRFVARYLPRITPASGDLSAGEVADLHRAGLAVFGVQHVERETAQGWIPSVAKGDQYGSVAAAHAQLCGLALGTLLVLDLENVDQAVPTAIVTQYCAIWYRNVARAGYTPGLYVGYNPGISAHDLYYRLPFEHYWGAYNVNADQAPEIRGFQIRQHAPVAGDVPAGVGFPIDVNTVKRDALGGLPLVYAPDEWDVTA